MSSADSHVEVLTIRAPVSVAVISMTIWFSGADATGLPSASAKKSRSSRRWGASTAMTSQPPGNFSPSGLVMWYFTKPPGVRSCSVTVAG